MIRGKAHLYQQIKPLQNKILKNPGNTKNNAKAGRWKRLKIQLIVFLCLFIIAEIVLRIMGMKPGTLIDDFAAEDNPVYKPRFVSDESGINHIVANSEMLMQGTVINAQGFRSGFDYTPHIIDSIRTKTKEKIVMLIGDSFVEGCCADNVQNSFPDIVNRDPGYCVLNFGVAGTDPLQYQLIAAKYARELKPDIIVVAFYFGNDIFTYERKATPGIPLTYPFKNNKWLFSVADNNVSLQENTVLRSPREAYEFYLDNYTLKGKSRNAFEKAISYSVIFSKLYLAAEHKLKQKRWQKLCEGKESIDVAAIPYKSLKRIKTTATDNQIPVVYIGIPAPLESEDYPKLREKYNYVFKELTWYTPDNLKIEDYDGTGVGNHFNNAGHIKYARFLTAILDSVYKTNK